MAFKVVIKPIVLFDLDEAVLYYEKKMPGLGKRFYDNFFTALNDIELKPFTYSYVRKPVRRHLIKKFPYRIFYFVNGDTIFILGVCHGKRSNAFLKRRLRLFE